MTEAKHFRIAGKDVALAASIALNIFALIYYSIPIFGKNQRVALPPEPTPISSPTSTPLPSSTPLHTPTPFAGYTCDQLMATPGPDGTGAGPGFGKFYNGDPTKPIICEVVPETGKGRLTHP